MDFKDYVKDFGVKGHCKIELTDVETGEVKMVERDNTISIQHKAYLKMMALSNLQPFARNYFKNIDRKYPISGLNWMQDLVMTDNVSVITDTHPTLDGNIIGFANAVNPYSGDDSLRGTINTVESKLEGTKATLVFDFPTHAANGVIGTVGFSSYYPSDPIGILKPDVNSMQGTVLNIVTGNINRNRYTYKGARFAYDYITKKIIMKEGYYNEKNIYSVDPTNNNVTKIGTSKIPYTLQSIFPYHDGKEYFLSNIDGKRYLVEHNLIDDTERVSSQPISASFNTSYSMCVRGEFIYWFDRSDITIFKLSDLSFIEKKAIATLPNIEWSTLTYCPIDDYIYSGCYKIKFENYYNGGQESDIEEAYPKKFSETPTYSGTKIGLTIKTEDGLFSPCSNTNGIIPSGYYRDSDEYRIDLLKLTDYPANWATAMVLPEVIEKNQTQTMKVTYSFSYEDLWKTEI